MDAKETVTRGLQARKDVRAAEAKAAASRAATVEERDARFHEQMGHKRDAARWSEEKARLESLIFDQYCMIRKLNRQLAERNRQEREARQRMILAGGLKGLIVFALLASAKDLGWVVPWLVNCLLVSTAAYMFYSVVTLAMKKK